MGKENLATYYEKKALAEITKERYDTIISEARNSENQEMAQALEKIMKKLKVKAILDEIKNLEKKKAMLDASIRAMGFDVYSGSINGLKRVYRFNPDKKTSENVIDDKTPAGREYNRMSKDRPEISKLIDSRDKAIAAIWLAVEKKQIKTVIDKEIKVPSSKNLLTS